MAHFNASDVYFGTYARFSTTNKKMGAALAGPDNAIGDIGDITWGLDQDKRQQAWLMNPYGIKIGFLDARTSHLLALYNAKGWTMKYVLSVVAYSEQPAPGEYWGQVALVAYAPRYAEQFEAFLHIFADRMGDGLRPDPDLNPHVVESITQNPSSWQAGSKVKMPKGDGRTAILKDHRSLHDKLLDQGRKKNIGCYIISWAFIIALIAAVAFLLHSLGLF